MPYNHCFFTRLQDRQTVTVKTEQILLTRTRAHPCSMNMPDADANVQTVVWEYTFLDTNKHPKKKTFNQRCWHLSTLAQGIRFDLAWRTMTDERERGVAFRDPSEFTVVLRHHGYSKTTYRASKLVLLGIQQWPVTHC